MKPLRNFVLISDDPFSRQHQAEEIYRRFENQLRERGLADQVSLGRISGFGSNPHTPFAVIYPQAVVYGSLHPEDVERLVSEHLLHERLVADLLVPPHKAGSLAWVYARQGALPAEQRIVLRRAGKIDPESLEDYLLHDGYRATAKALTEMSPQEVIEEVTRSGLQGRGGAGFPVGRKWQFVAAAQGRKKYVICNADESEPGTFKDRVILESDPHAIIEAMIISGYAIQAHEGYIYVRGEYPLAQERFQRAVEQARQHGLLGKNILGSGFAFDIHLHSGAGAYICGEETALIESLEGKRGEPRSRPPYPTTYGLWGQPTVVNNVETLANVPPIILNGGDWYRQFGTPSSPGTKVYCILGNVNRRGVIEVPMGITLREVIAIYAGGMQDGAAFKLAQTGGSSGSVIPATLQDTPLDFEAHRKTGVSLGSGALLICDERTCIVDLAKVLLQFFRFESCGKCTPCRIGTQRAYEILTRLTEGQGELADLDALARLADHMERLSNCGLGQTAAVPLRDMLKHFRTEVEAHIRLGVCPSGVCPMALQGASLILQPQ